MAQEITITGFVGGGTGGTFQVALATAGTGGTVIEVLGSVDVVGAGADQEVMLDTPITLVTGTIYALASGRTDGSGSFFMMNNIDMSAIEAHPIIETGTWRPVQTSGVDAYIWGSGIGGFTGTPGTTNVIPRIGFIYQ